MKRKSKHVMKTNRSFKNAEVRTSTSTVSRIFIFLMILSITLMGCEDSSYDNVETSTPDAVILSFNANDGSGNAPVRVYYTADESIILPGDESFVKEGYRLMGWNIQADGSVTDFASGQTITLDDLWNTSEQDQEDVLEVILYAWWEKTYSVIYNANGGEDSIVPLDETLYIEGETATVLSSLTRDGYRFMAWNTKADGSGSDFSPGYSLSIVGTTDITLYARWKEEYSVSYDGNGIDDIELVPEDNKTYIEGEMVSVLYTELIRDEYRFMAWNNEAEGGGDNYPLPEEEEVYLIMGTASITLYAQWAEEYSVSYDSNSNGDDVSGDVPVDNTPYIAGETVSVLDANLSLDGYRFMGWYTMSDATADEYFLQDDEVDTIEMGTANIILYAWWKETYKVIYDANEAEGGEVPEDETAYIEGEEVTVKDNTGNLVKATENFESWNTQSDDSGNKLSQGDTFTMGDSDITLYAQWESKPTYWLTYYINTDGSDDSQQNEVVEGSTIIVASEDTFQRTGYRITSWNNEEDGTGTSYTPDGTFTMGAADIDLYAQWERAYSVSYDSNGDASGVLPADNVAYIEGELVTAAYNSGFLDKEDANFESWNTQSDGSGNKLSQGDTFTMGNSDITLYAQWSTEPEYCVHYDINGGDDAVAAFLDHMAVEGSKFIVRPTDMFELEGHIMTHWNTLANDSGTSYDSGDLFTMGSEDIILYAQYDTIHVIIFDGGEDTSGDPPETVYVYGNEAFTIDTTTNMNLEKLGHEFDHWNTDVSGDGKDYKAGESYTTDTDLHLYAQWTAIDYTLSYDSNGADGGAVPDTVTLSGFAGGDSIEISGNDNGLYKDDYFWGGWSTDWHDAGGNCYYEEGDSILINYFDRILYACWEPSVKQVSTGDYHTIVLGVDGSLQGVGHNGYGQLGDDTDKPVHSSLIDITDDVEAAWATDYCTMFLKSDGSLWATGWNDYGQLGLGDTTDRHTPTEVDVTGDVETVFLGTYHTMILTSDENGTNKLWATGRNTIGQLGLGDTTNRYTPTEVKDITGDVVAVSTGKYHTMLLKTDNSLWAAGYNLYGQLGDGTTTNRDEFIHVMDDVDGVWTGKYYTIILKPDASGDSKLWAAGYNAQGQLGDGSTTNRDEPVLMNDDGAGIVWGDTVTVAASYQHTMILTNDTSGRSSLWGTGDNGYGQLGLGDTNDRLVLTQMDINDISDVRVGSYHTMILKTDNSLWATGRNNYGQLIGGTTSYHTTPIYVIPLSE